MQSWLLTPWIIIVALLSLAAFAVEVFALVVALKAPAAAYTAAGKLSKGAWVAITAVATLIGFSAAPLPLLGGSRGFGGLLSIAALVAALVFIVDVRPAVSGASGGRGRPGPRQQGGW
ncbi:MAG: DUF2516 family protein [Bifidobacteriaceae bacterium]|jgi:hypothetical protein|nr:DUF2516 family protein [Bifidobacteriaceae bacterium]